MIKKLPKIIVILGPTASGKSDLAVKIALLLNSQPLSETRSGEATGQAPSANSGQAPSASSGQAKKKFGVEGAEIISADSRQVYRGMDIGTGKITKKETRGVPHWLLDVASPKKRFTVTQYKKLAEKAIDKILKNGGVPILCGGTGFYIQAVIDDLSIPLVHPDWKLRKKLEKKSVSGLFAMLKKFDPARAKTIDKNNPRRLIRAIEIIKKTGKPVPKLEFGKPKFNVLMLGIKKSPEELKRRIKKRLLKRFKQGMIAEVKRLRKTGISWKRLEEFGLEYRWIARYLQKKIPYREMAGKLQKDIEHYAKRQMTWFTRQNFAPQNLGGFKRDKRIRWIKDYKEAAKLVRNFLRKAKQNQAS